MRRVPVPTLALGMIVAAYTAGARQSAGQSHYARCFFPQTPGMGCAGCTSTGCTACADGICAGTITDCNGLHTFLLRSHGASTATLVEKVCHVAYNCHALNNPPCYDGNQCVKDPDSAQPSGSTYWDYVFSGNCSVPERLDSGSDSEAGEFVHGPLPSDLGGPQGEQRIPPIEPTPIRWGPHFP